MKLQTKTSGIILLVIGVFMILILVVQSLFVMPKFKTINIEKAYDDVDQGLQFINDELDNMLISASDYAVWDDTYDFTNNVNSDYAAKNFTQDSLKNLNMSFVGIFSDEDVLFSYNDFGDAKKTEKIQQALVDLDISQSNNIKGFLTVGDITYMIAVKQISNTDLSISSNYYFAFLREYKDYLNENFSNLPDLSITLMDLASMKMDEKDRIENIYTSQDFKSDVYHLSKNTFYERSPNASIWAYAYLYNTNGQPFAILKSETSNTIIQEGEKLASQTYIFLSLLGLMLALIITMFINHSIIRPLNQLKKGLHTMMMENEPNIINHPSIIGRDDEIGDLTKSFISISREIKQAREESDCINTKLELIVKERTKALQMANEELILFGESFEETSEGIIITDLMGMIVKCNRAFAESTGYTKKELYGENPRIIKSGKYNSYFYKNMWDCLIMEGKWEGEIWDKRKNGQTFPAWLTIDAIRDDSKKVNYYVGVLSDLTAKKEMETKLERMAFYDTLTGLPNRVLFYDHLQRAILRANRYRYKLAVIHINLDGFKLVNETFGHRNGDVLLSEIGKRIKHQVRESDLVSRIGGDEFSIVLEGVKTQEALVKIANSLLTDISLDIKISEELISMTASIGIAIYPEDGSTIEEIMKKVDAAMFSSKATGKNCYTFASNNDEITMIPKIIMINHLRKAIERSEFYLVYQPQVKVAFNKNGLLKSEIFGAEALIRWTNDKGEVFMPDEFIDLAEEAGLIIPIGEWVIEEACKTIREQKPINKPIHISINVSIRQFKSRQLVNVIRSTIEKTEIDAKNLFIEITESIFAEDESMVISIINELKALGITIVLDDFGKGYSSLGLISKLPFDFIKIDKQFIQNSVLEEDNNLATTILTMADKLNMQSICEGVETQEQVEYLLKNGAEIFQGFYFSKPIEKDHYMALCRGEWSLDN